VSRLRMPSSVATGVVTALPILRVLLESCILSTEEDAVENNCLVISCASHLSRFGLIQELGPY
jgi:hypothetical protein